MARLEVQDLTLGYRAQTIVQSLAIRVEPGEVLGLIGPNGVGKTTVLRALAGLVTPPQGAVLIDNTLLRELTALERARAIGVVPQSEARTGGLTVGETVALGRAAYRGWLLPLSKQDHDAIERALTWTDLLALREHPTDQLSGGEYQFVLIARALAQESKILLLDEPTANLDLQHQLRLLDLVSDLAQRHALAVVMAIHDLTLAARYCDTLALLHRGKLIAIGSPDDVLTRGNLRVVYGVDGLLYRDPQGQWAVGFQHPIGETSNRGNKMTQTERATTKDTNANPEADATRRAAREKPIRKGLVIVNTGNGKGKTTAALGVVTRAWGRDMRVGILQFLKNEHARFGEIRAAEKMGFEMIPMGDGFTWTSRDLDESAARAVYGWQRAQERIANGNYEVLVLDEFTYPLHYGWLDVNEVIGWLRANKPPMLHLIITGRYAPEALIEYADLVTEMKLIKHPFKEQGIRAQPGIEF